MMSDDKIISKYLQAAHDRNGSWQMAMSMMLNDLYAARDNKPEVYGFGIERHDETSSE